MCTLKERLRPILKNTVQRRRLAVQKGKIESEMLLDAITTQKFKLARIMIEGGVNVNISVAGVTPMMIACLIPQKNSNEDKHELIELLLEYGSNLDVRDNFGGTALHYAHMCCCSRTIRFIEKCRDKTKICWRNKGPLSSLRYNRKLYEKLLMST
jgi:hypothetical protein